MARRSEDKELEQYRTLMLPPEEFADGFTWKTVVGAIFLGMLIMPGAMYLSLVVGPEADLGSAARWATIILFAEVARRSFRDLKMQEVYIFYFMAGLAMMAPFSGLLWSQYFVRSEFAQAMGVAQDVPTWSVPSAETIARDGRTFFTRAWLVPILLGCVGLLVSRLDQYGFGYVLYRITNDIEELPFPMAPVAASGITALAESRTEKEPWRWRCFSIGGVLGIVFGIVYIGIPAVTAVFLTQPLQLIPIPWVDLTPALAKILPATGINISFNLTAFFVGMVLPFWAVMGGVVGVIFTMVASPILYYKGILSHWNPQMNVIDTIFTNNVDFYLSFSFGVTIAITVISLGKVLKPLGRAFRWKKSPGPSKPAVIGPAVQRPSAWKRLITNNVKRGDFSIFIALAIYFFSSAFWIGLSCYLVPGFPWKFFVFYVLVLTPLISYATAKLEGLCGQTVSIPYLREATYILSGYKGIQIWFAPAPLPNYGVATVDFRVLELTGTKIKGQIKTQLVTIPIVAVASIVFSQLLWQMSDVPSAAYPYAQKMWDLAAKTSCLTLSSTMEGGSLFMEALKLKHILAGLFSGTITYIVLATLGLPTLLVFGVVRGLGQGTPSAIIFELIGALVGRFYFRRKFGKVWMKYTPILLAGFSCGMGLVGLVAVGFTVLNKMIQPLMF